MPIVHFEAVSKQFSPESFALRDVTFVVEPGELVFITGPSGSGKTTIMRLLTREYDPTQGEIFFRDDPISKFRQGNVHLHRRRIGVVFQDYRLIPDMNIWENIALPLYLVGGKNAEIEQRVTDLLNLIKLTDKAELFPNQLSGGEAQRVSIARALANAPEVLFADEPTGNLDTENALHIAKLLRKINELGTTVFVATHDTEILSQHRDVRTLAILQGSIASDSGVKKSTSPKSEKKKVVQVDENKPTPSTETSKKTDPLEATDTKQPSIPSSSPWWSRWVSKKSPSPATQTPAEIEDIHSAPTSEDAPAPDSEIKPPPESKKIKVKVATDSQLKESRKKSSKKL